MFVSGNQNCNVYVNRYKGYKAALEEWDIPLDPEMMVETKLSIEEGINIAYTILKMDKRPDGIFIANDACAAGLMTTLKSGGVIIPNEIVIAGFNNDPISRLVEPKLTTVNYPGIEMGEMVSNLMINHLNGISNLTMTNRIILKAELLKRESTARKFSL
jgi:LacI family transcriptional regulator